MLNDEGLMLLGLFAYLLCALFMGLTLYGRADVPLGGSRAGAARTALGAVGALFGPLTLFAVPGLFLIRGQAAFAIPVGLLIACALLCLCAGKLRALYARFQATSFSELLCHATGKAWAGVFASGLQYVFAVWGVSACLLAMAKLIAGAFALHYGISLGVSAFLLLVYALFATFRTQQRMDVLKACLLITGLLGFALCFGAYRSFTPSAFVPQTPATLTDILSDFTIGFCALGLPTLHSRLLAAQSDKEARKATLPFLILTAVIALCLIICALYLPSWAAGLNTQADKEVVLLLFALDDVQPFFCGLLLTALMAGCIATGSGILYAASSALAKDALPLCFPEVDSGVHKLSQRLLILIATGLAAVPALEQGRSVYALMGPALAGCAAITLPLFLYILLGKRPTGLQVALSTGAAATLVLIWALTPTLSMAFFPLLPGLAAGIAGLVVGGLIRPKQTLSA